MSEAAATDLAFFLPSVDGGGVERMALNLAGHFVKQGLRVDIVVVKKRGSLLNQVPEGVRLVSLDAPASILGIPRFIRYFRQARPRAMFSGITSINLVALWSKLLSGADTRMVISERVAISENVKTHPLKRPFPLLIRLFYPKADAIVAVSRGLADDLAQVGALPRNSIQVIYNPVVTPEFLQRAGAKPAHPWLQDQAVPVILGVGRLVPQKDFATLIRAFALARRQRPMRLLILGDGEEGAALEALIKDLGIADSVQLAGFTENPAAYMASASLFVLSSIYEGFGNVLVEALACGCPIVSTDCPYGPSEILENGRYGSLVPVKDAPAMAQAMLALLEAPPAREKLRERADAFTADKIAAQYQQLLFPAEGIPPESD